MRIDSSTVGMESARSYQASNTTVRRFMIKEYQGELTYQGNELYASVTAGQEEGTEAQGASDKEQTEGAEDNKVTLLEAWQSRFGITSGRISSSNSRSSTMENLRQVTIRYIFDMLFSARRSRLQQWVDEQGLSRNTYYTGSQNSNLTASAQSSQVLSTGNAVSANFKVLSYTQESIHTEREDTSFSTVGTVRTADGREINFNVNVGMSREFQEYYREDLELASFTMCDPLVINLDTDVAALDDQTFYFDIDADGEMDEISGLGSGSGYLALDKNGDGVINDGSELFGTSSGNGFADLAEYDDDGNGWIDEGDAIWDKLQIWCKDENGQDKLYKLSEKGVGAICLQNAATDFTLKGSDGQTKGAIRNSGVFLYENGNVGTIQHVDVAKYSKEA